VLRFDVERYDPDYALYRPVETANGSEADGYSHVGTFRIPALGEVDLGQAGTVDAAALRNEDGQWVSQRVLDDGWILQRLGPVDRAYRAVLKITDDARAPFTRELAVNSPVSHRGWRFYLMSYDNEAERYVVLSARRDPGRRVVISGIWALMIGIALMCWTGRKRAG
jgi:hypothetical protein